MSKSKIEKELIQRRVELVSLIPKHLESKTRKLSDTTKAVLGACIQICSSQNIDEQGYFFASKKMLSELVGFSSTSMHNSLQTLLNKGLIELVEEGGFVNGLRQANRWKLTFDYSIEETNTATVEEQSDLRIEVESLKKALNYVLKELNVYKQITKKILADVGCEIQLSLPLDFEN